MVRIEIKMEKVKTQVHSGQLQHVRMVHKKDMRTEEEE